MSDAEDLRADIDQHEIAERVLLMVLRLTLDHPDSMTRTAVAAMLRMASEERDRQGDYLAGGLLDVWATLAEKEMADEGGL